MPRYCQFAENVRFHRSLANMPHEHGIVGVGLVSSRSRSLSHNVRTVLCDVQDCIDQHQFLPDNFIWCTREEYEHNWPYLANELLRTRPTTTDTSPIVPALDMPKFSVGITKNLDIITRDSNGRWIYLEKTGNTVEVVLSDVAPDCLVVYRTGDSDASRRLSEDRYWVTVRGGNYVIVRPPINCPNDIRVPYGSFLNSRFVFHGDNSYVIESVLSTQVFLVGNEEITTFSYPRAGVYGQLVLHEDGTKVYMTLTPVYPDIFGCKFTRKYRVPIMSAFDVSPSSLCGRLSDTYNINTIDDEYVDCLTGDTLTYGSHPTLCHGIPTRDIAFRNNFVTEDGVHRSVWLRSMSVDEDGNKVYRNFDDGFMMNMLRNVPFNAIRNCLMEYEGESYRWDGRNSAWIRAADAVYIPPRASRSALDIFTHSRFVQCVECPLCHSKTVLNNRYTFTYFIDGQKYSKPMCDRCIATLFDGNPLDISIEDGSVLHVNGCDVCGCDGEYTLSKWWVRVPGEEEGFVDEYAVWNHETQQWELVDDEDGALYLAFTPRGYILTERYCTHINGYFYKPEPIFFKGNDENTHKFFGIELEVMDGGESSDNAKEVCRNHEELYAKHDGSLTNGMELVSHPCTVGWHLTHLWTDVLTRLRTLRYHARNGSGIHVHVSRKYWENNGGACHIANLITFCDTNREALRLYANREEETFDHWTHSYMSPSATKKTISTTLRTLGDTEEAMQDMYERYSGTTDHYSVVNLSNASTVEIRAFASTLSITRMHSIIQFVDVLTELSTEATLGNPITFGLIQTRARDKGYTALLQDPKFAEAIEESNRHVDTRICS
nr:MAG TPA: Putative amidoligase enzyme [Caudoviricetes sp.]